jgi:ligand-binding SRPBCC domain-containing protein
MIVLCAITNIAAPIEVCFRATLNIDLELLAGEDHKIEAVEGVTSGVIGAGERVTWRTRQFGLWIKHTTEITAMNEPVYFQDSMVKGLFRSFRHDHFFRSIDPTTTEMRDDLRFSMPIVLMGLISEHLFVKRRLATLLEKRNEVIRRYAETLAI